MRTDSETDRRMFWLPLVALAGAKLLLHLVTNATGGYGYFRDELYYLASTRHLDWGYVDHPPLSVALLALQRWLFGDSIFALRLLPALAGALTVAAVMLLARELGGGRWAMTLAGTAALVSPIVLAFSTIYSMNALNLLTWVVAAWLIARLVNRERPRDWLWLGLVLGVGLLNKVDLLWLGTALLLALLATPMRRWLRTPGPWTAGGIALLLFSPYVIWNLTHGMPHAEFIANAVAGKYSQLGLAEFVIGQLLVNNPVTLPLWVGGLIFLFSARGRRYRVLGVLFAGVVAILIANGSSKPEYLAGAMGVAFAAGGVAWEGWFRDRRRWVRPVLQTVLIAGLVLAPITLPILPVDTFIRYARVLGLEPHTSEAKELDELPQFYADMFGWREKAEAVAAAYRSLPPAEQSRVAIFGANYGRAGAIDFFGPELGLPGAISSHNSYWLWGPGDSDGGLMLFLGGGREDLDELFESVEEIGRVDCRYCMPYESDLGIFLARRSRVPLAQLWPRLKNFS